MRIYFYFLATKIVIIKFFKKIYFSTSYYNKFLQSRIPERFHYYPNPFLLSIFTSHKNFSFKVENVKPHIFWTKKETRKERDNLHNFLWLNLLDRKNENLVIQEIVGFWIHKNSKYKSEIWNDRIIGKRIISWILNAEIILKNTDGLFKVNFFQSILVQINHLKKNVKFITSQSKKIEVVTAIILSGLVFREYKENFDFGTKELKKIIVNNFDENGFPNNRNPNDLISFSKFFILIKECIKDAQILIPEYLEEIIEKNLNCLNSIKTSNEKMPLFNGATEIDITNFLSYIDRLNYKLKKTNNIVGKIYILKNKKHDIFFDVGSTPPLKLSNKYQSGPLSFEYVIGENKIVTNCGYGNQISKKAELISRLTSAQSTLCIDNTSVVKFERNKILNNILGNSLKTNFKVYNLKYENNEQQIIASAEHNAYEKQFGFCHKREINLIKKNSCLQGTDFLIKKESSPNELSYHIRFHLYPGISAVKTIGGDGVLIQVEKNKSLMFKSQDQKIIIEKSIFLGRNQILNNFCITLSGIIKDKDKKIDWKFTKDI